MEAQMFWGFLRITTFLSLIGLGNAACTNNLTLPDPSSGTITYVTDTGSTNTGAKANVTCNSGYVIIGTNSGTLQPLCVGGLNPWTFTNITNCVPKTTTIAPLVPTYCTPTFCSNGGTCKSGTTNGIPTATCACLSGFVGPTCSARAQSTVDLDEIRSLSQDAYYTQKYPVDWSKESVSGDQLKIAMSCSVAVMGAMFTAGSYYLSKCLFPKPAPNAGQF